LFIEELTAASRAILNNYIIYLFVVSGSTTDIEEMLISKQYHEL
jgi:hypothetical protein